MKQDDIEKIAKDWCKSILLANDITSFIDLDHMITIEDQHRVVDECHYIANKLSKRKPLMDLGKIVRRILK